MQTYFPYVKINRLLHTCAMFYICSTYIDRLDHRDIASDFDTHFWCNDEGDITNNL